MDLVLRAAAVYFFLLILLRISGRRKLSEITIFEFVLLMIISESTQQALLGQDYSITGSYILITTLIGIDIAFSLLRSKWNGPDKIVSDVPIIIVDNGKLLDDRLKKLRVDEGDILEAARRLRGLERLDQIKYAVIEKDGNITIIPSVRQKSLRRIRNNSTFPSLS